MPPAPAVASPCFHTNGATAKIGNVRLPRMRFFSLLFGRHSTGGQGLLQRGLGVAAVHTAGVRHMSEPLRHPRAVLIWGVPPSFSCSTQASRCQPCVILFVSLRNAVVGIRLACTKQLWSNFHSLCSESTSTASRAAARCHRVPAKNLFRVRKASLVLYIDCSKQDCRW